MSLKELGRVIPDRKPTNGGSKTDGPEAAAPLPARASQVYADIDAIIKERDGLVDLRRRLEAENALLTHKVQSLQETKDTLSRERDWYMRYCTELHTNLFSIQRTIDDAVATAKVASYRSNNPVPAQPKAGVVEQGDELEEGLREIASRFAPQRDNET